jgi:hypothetical protein
MEWLERTWLPQAIQLGLRYIAHIVQQDTNSDVLRLTYPAPVISTVELQLFDDVARAQAWLLSCQHPLNAESHRPLF